MNGERKLHTVTGATGYTGRYIAELLLKQGHRVQSITGHPARENPFGDQVPLHPFDFNHPDELRRTLEGTDTLFNTYWIRVNHGGRTHEECVEQTKVMFNAARDTGVRENSHISITNPSPESDLPYFRGKGQFEDALRELEGVSHAILRPTVLYSREDVLLNNIAWTPWKFPAVLLPGDGKYGIQPVFAEDLARIAVDAGQGDGNVEMDAVGPEVHTHAELTRLVRKKTSAKCLVLPAPKWLTLAAAAALGKILGDILISQDEIKGDLQRTAGITGRNAGAPTRLTEWLDENGSELGRRHASQVKRHHQR